MDHGHSPSKPLSISSGDIFLLIQVYLVRVRVRVRIRVRVRVRVRVRIRVPDAVPRVARLSEGGGVPGEG